MPLSQPVPIYGVHSLTAYNINTRMPLGTAKVVGEATLNSAGELKTLMGGSSNYPFKVERGAIENTVSLTLKEYPDFLFETLLGKAVTSNSAESSGSVTAIANANGTSVVDSSTGIASVGLRTGDNKDVPFAQYTVKAVSATTVDVYAMTDLDFAQGTDKEFENDALKITASPLTITASTAVEIPDFGLELTGGSGTIGMTEGDTATFTSRPINTRSREVVIGSTSEVFNDFGLIIAAQRQGDNIMQILDCYRCVGSGLPIALTEKEFSEAQVELQLYRDSTRNGVYRLEEVEATS